MGLFDKKDKKKKGKQDDFDSPIEQIDLSAPDPAPPPKAAAAPRAEPKTIEAEPAPKASKPKRREPEPEPDDFDAPSYGINKAIELMRTLPTDNIELVVTVIKHTLESTKIKIGEIIEDAAHKQDDIQGRIKVLKGEISEFESEIATRKEEIEGLEADYTETTQVKEHLQLAEQLDKKPAGKTATSGGANKAKAAGSIGQAARQAVSGNHKVGAPGASKPKPKPTLSGASSKTTVVAKK
jgi:hypothetical protein